MNNKPNNTPNQPNLNVQMTLMMPRAPGDKLVLIFTPEQTQALINLDGAIQLLEGVVHKMKEQRSGLVLPFTRV